MSLSPRLIVIAGPNGAGETTLTEAALAHEWLDGCLYINPDVMAQERFGGWNDPNAVLKAAQEAERLREDCLSASESLAFETVFSTQNKLDYLRRAKVAGYFTRLFFVGTKNPTINAARVAQRVREGGHDVPIPKIVSRHEKSMVNLLHALRFVDRGYVYDNSNDGELPSLTFRTAHGRLVRRYDARAPWSDQISETLGRTGPSPLVNCPSLATQDDGPVP